MPRGAPVYTYSIARRKKKCRKGLLEGGKSLKALEWGGTRGEGGEKNGFGRLYAQVRGIPLKNIKNGDQSLYGGRSRLF